MDKKTEALKLALETLESDWDGCVNSPKGEAITAIREALAEESSGTEQPAQCRHRIADARNPVVKSGYLCVDCGALFAAADHTNQPAQQPVAMRYDFDGYGYKYIDAGSGSDWQTRIKDAEPVYASPQPAQQQKPVAWVREHELPLAPGDAFSWVETFVHKTPLYTSPPASKPLTDDEIDEAQDAAEESFHAMNKGLKPRPLSERASYFDWHLARAIEAAHGITGEQP